MLKKAPFSSHRTVHSVHCVHFAPCWWEESVLLVVRLFLSLVSCYAVLHSIRQHLAVMYLHITLLSLLLLGWTNLSILILLVNVLISNFGKRFFAGFCANFTGQYNEASNSLKIELFKELNDMKKGEKISILEVGPGPGANFKYFDRDAVVQTVEPNDHFVKYFDENRAKFPKLEIKEMKQGFCEDLSSTGISDASVDAVVMTRVLCSVKDQKKCLEEIKRVLKPGGKFF